MKDIYCDIIPRAEGWTYAIGVANPAHFASFNLALNAAVAESEVRSKEHNVRDVILRRRDLRGRMLEIRRLHAKTAK